MAIEQPIFRRFGDTLIASGHDRGQWMWASGPAFPDSTMPQPHAGAVFFRTDLGAHYSFASGTWTIVGGAGLHTHVEADVTGLVADLAAKEATANKGVAGGYASLDGSGTVPDAQIPAAIARDAEVSIVADTSAAAAIVTHAALPDPHTGYQKESEKDAALGYAGLSALSKLTGSQQTYGVLANTACEGNDVRLSGGTVPTGTGLRHVTAGIEDAATKLVDTADINNDQVTPAKLDNGSGFSVLGKATTGAGDRADIVAADETVLGRTAAGNVAFAALATGQIAAKAITYAKIQDVSATDRLLGRDSAGSGVVEEITVAAALTMLGAFGGITLQQFTATGANTYTPTTGMKHCIAITTGGGGGGGGADVTGAADTGAGAGGGAGGTCIEAFSAATIGASQTVTIGAGGTAGNNTGGNGGGGTNSTFGALHTANGGNGGTGSGAASTVNTRTVAGGVGGTPTGGLVNMTGGTGDNGWAMQTTDATDTSENSIAFGGIGGASMWGGGGRGGANAQDAAAGDSTAGSEAGSNGAAKGSGGGGGVVNNTATGVAGGTGADGFCLVIEFT